MAKAHHGKVLSAQDNGNLPRGTWTTDNGVELTLRGIPPLFLERLVNDKSGEPKPPKVLVTYGKGRKGEEENPNDPDYLEKLEAWKKDRQITVMSVILTMGIENEPPQNFVYEMSDVFPWYTERQMKYLWLTTIVPNDDKVSELVESIMSLTIATEESVDEAMDQFPDSGEREGRETALVTLEPGQSSAIPAR